jgi:RNA polymerase sigma-B factor
MPLVEALAHRHERRGAEHDDLIQAGSIGLLNAIERFDPKLGEEFAAFAVPTIAGEMKRHLRDRTDSVRLPRRLHEARSGLPRIRQEVTARLGRAPSPSELADAAGVSTNELARLEGATIETRALETEKDESDLNNSESRLLLADAFRSLDDTERTIIYLRYIQERSRREVAEELRISPSALTRRTTSALGKLRGELEGRAFEPGSQAAAPERAKSVGSGAHNAPPAEAEGDGSPGPDSSSAPDPKTQTGHSGRLMLRMPQSLHAELARAAEDEDVSLNQYITNTLSASLRWRASDERAASDERPASNPRWLPAAIVTNIVVVVIAGLVALILLLVALQQGW